MSSLKKLLLIPFLTFYCFNLSYSQFFVTPTGNGVKDGSSWDNAFENIQEAIDAASFGDEVWVQMGTYKPSYTNRSVSFTLKSGVKLYGGFSGTELNLSDRLKSDINNNGIIEDWEFSNTTILSGDILEVGVETDNSLQVVTIPEGADASTTINGFTIENGYNDATKVFLQAGSKYYASGIIAAGGNIENCIIQNCQNISPGLSYGGGLFVGNSTVISHCFINNCSSNAGGSQGGGIYISGSELQNSKVLDCYVTGSSSASLTGGGIFSINSAITNSEINACYADEGFNSAGGGIYNQGSIATNTIVHNCQAKGTSAKGGGIFNISSRLYLSKVYNCSSNNEGGATYSDASSITNCLIFNNSSAFKGGGMSINNTYVINCTVTNNNCSEDTSAGGGIYADTDSDISNSVIWGNILIGEGSTPQINLSNGSTSENCAIQDGGSENSNINLSELNTGDQALLYPRFINPSNFNGIAITSENETNIETTNWDIEKTSALIEGGNNNKLNERNVGANGTDLNGNGNTTDIASDFKDFNDDSRLFNASVDIGAYESIFIDLILPQIATIEYGTSLSEITLLNGSAVDNRDGSIIAGLFAFTNSSEVPPISDPVIKYPIEFIADNEAEYPRKYDELAVNVTQRTLNVINLVADDKIYDGTNSATFSGNPLLEGIIGNDDVTLESASVNATFEDKNVSDDKTVSYSGYTLAGADATNYTLQSVTSQANITSKPIKIAPLTAENKQYNRNTIASFVETPTLDGLIIGDDVSINIGDANFEDSNIGNNKLVVYSGFTISGTDSNNYSLSQADNSYANITPVELKIEGITISNKTYDGNITASLGGNPSITGVLSGDDVLLDAETIIATFENKNVGIDKTVSLSNINLSGANKDNYTLTNPGSFTATITKKELTIIGLGVADKNYDQSTNATLNGTASLQGGITGDDISINTTSPNANFEDANAGNQKNIELETITLIGLDNDNYSLTQPILTASILPLNISIKADDKTIIYGDEIPELSYTINLGEVLVGDNFSGALSHNGDINAGNYNITIGDLSLGNNYSITYTSGTLTINKAPNKISFNLEPSVEFTIGGTIQLFATANSGEIVAFESSNNNIASISDDILNLNSYGQITVTAEANGNNNYEAANSVSLPLQILLNVDILKKGSNMILIDNKQEQFTSYKWYNNNIVIPDATKQFYHNGNGLAGEYYCEVITINGDTFTSETLDFSETKSVSIYPSLANVGENINVKLEDNSSSNSTTISIYNSTGILVKQFIQSESIQSFNLDKKGVYIVKTNGQIKSTQKIIIK